MQMTRIYFGGIMILRFSAAKPDPFFRVESGRVGPQDKKTGPIGSGQPQIGFRFGFNPIMYLINSNIRDLNPILGRVEPPGSKFGLSRVGLGPQGPNSGWVGQGWLGSFGRTTPVDYFSVLPSAAQTLQGAYHIPFLQLYIVHDGKICVKQSNTPTIIFRENPRTDNKVCFPATISKQYSKASMCVDFTDMRF